MYSCSPQLFPKLFGSTPAVFFNQSFESLPKRCFAVCHDSKHTGTLAARELLVSEAEHFTYIPAPSNPFWSQERKQGFTEALALNGKKCIDFNWPKTADTATQRTKILQNFLLDLPKPCAIFAANDALSAEIITATKLSGIAIPDEIQSVRLDRTKQLLLNPNQDIKSISDFCGFGHPNSLRKFFLKETGMTLSAWRKAHLNKSIPYNPPII